MQNDLISRSALMKVFRDAIPSLEKHVEMDQLACLNSCIEDLQNAPAVDAVEVGSCDGCYWKEIGRQQKCSCCRRNWYLKDCYEAKMEG